MKSTIATKELKEAIQKVNCIRLARLQLPVLGYAHADFSNGKLTLTATDLQHAIKVEIDSTNSKQYNLLLPRKSLANFLYTGKNSQDKNDKVEISQGSLPSRIGIKRGKIGDANFYTIPEKEFPPITFTDKLEWNAIDGKWFCRMLKIVSMACATEDSRPILTGIAMKDGELASADGFRLALLRDVRLNFGLGDKQAIVHRDAINIIIRLFSKEDMLNIAFELVDGFQPPDSNIPPKKFAKRIYLKSGNTLFMAETMQGTFPNYEQLIPKSYLCKASFSVPLMIQCLNMMDIKSISSGITRYYFRNLPTNESVCQVQARSEEECEYSFEVPIKILDGNKAKIAIQHKYIVDALKPFSVCEWETSSLSSPIKLTGDIEGLTIVVMPMSVQW